MPTAENARLLGTVLAAHVLPADEPFGVDAAPCSSSNGRAVAKGQSKPLRARGTRVRVPNSGREVWVYDDANRRARHHQNQLRSAPTEGDDAAAAFTRLMQTALA